MMGMRRGRECTDSVDDGEEKKRVQTDSVGDGDEKRKRVNKQGQCG